MGLNSFVSKNFEAIDQAAYVYTWNGKAWASVKLALGASTLLPAVGTIVCRSSGDCVALGQTLPGRPLADQGRHVQRQEVDGQDAGGQQGPDDRGRVPGGEVLPVGRLAGQ